MADSKQQIVHLPSRIKLSGSSYQRYAICYKPQGRLFAISYLLLALTIMRIIGGNARGRRLKVPKGQAVRPTAARVKEALFDILPHDLSGKKVLDLFAGTGNLTI